MACSRSENNWVTSTGALNCRGDACACCAIRSGCLRRHNAVGVLRDQFWMPAPLSLVQRADLDVMTGPFVYIRLLRSREAVDALTKTLDHIVIDRGAEVEMDARAMQVLRQRALAQIL